ncbi:hypothetical protein [Collimonas silvisoli]|nr:hypothetical protein [Collimonas silvisoli]
MMKTAPGLAQRYPSLFFGDGLQVGKTGSKILADHVVHIEKQIH